MKKGVSIMKKKRNLASFFAGVMTVLLAFGCLTSAMAASGEVTYNFANVTLNGRLSPAASHIFLKLNGIDDADMILPLGPGKKYSRLGKQFLMAQSYSIR